jgi:uncharacterized protein YjbJ (UPF0337 family)
MRKRLFTEKEMTMKTQWDTIAGQWKQYSGKVKQQWGKLTDDELMEVNGDREILAGKIQEKYGITRDQAHKQVDDWFDKLKV